MMEPGQKAHEVFKREWGCEPGWGNLSARYKAAWAAVEAACVPAVPADVEGLVESLKKPVYSDDLMIRWDCWRKRHKEGFGGSATRDEFESIIDWIDEERAAAASALQAQAAEIERLNREACLVFDNATSVARQRNAATARADATEAKLREAVEEFNVIVKYHEEADSHKTAADYYYDIARAFLATMEKPHE